MKVKASDIPKIIMGKMNMNKLHGILESVLFAAGEAVKADKLAEIAGVSENEIHAEMKKIQKYYEKESRGFAILEIDEGYQICTRPEYYSYVQEIAGIRRQQGLSNAALEVLSIVAYNQPVTKGTIEYVRGVNSDGAVYRLVERGLIEEKGRLDAPGKPILYVTTQEFLRNFGLKTLDDLPDLDAEIETPEYGEQLSIDI